MTTRELFLTPDPTIIRPPRSNKRQADGAPTQLDTPTALARQQHTVVEQIDDSVDVVVVESSQPKRSRKAESTTSSDQSWGDDVEEETPRVAGTQTTASDRIAAAVERAAAILQQIEPRQRSASLIDRYLDELWYCVSRQPGDVQPGLDRYELAVLWKFAKLMRSDGSEHALLLDHRIMNRSFYESVTGCSVCVESDNDDGGLCESCLEIAQSLVVVLQALAVRRSMPEPWQPSAQVAAALRRLPKDRRETPLCVKR